jgi:hypothetical protein
MARSRGSCYEARRGLKPSATIVTSRCDGEDGRVARVTIKK